MTQETLSQTTLVNRLQSYEIPRRGFLAIAGLLIGYTVAKETMDHFVAPRLAPRNQQLAAWNEAANPNDWFLKKYQHKLDKVTIGGSFRDPSLNKEATNPLETLTSIVEGLHIRDLRSPFSWSEVMRQKGQIDLSLYRPLLNHCLKTGVKLCLNAGIKTFGWPEEKPPDFLKDIFPQKGAVITPDMEISKYTTEYLGLLFHQLTSEYGEDLRKNTPIIQIENEPFINFGVHGWTISDEQLKDEIAVAQSYFPQSKYLFNSGPFKVDPVSHLFDRLAKRNIQLVYGTDYYPWIDDHTSPYNSLLQLALANGLDLVTLSKIAGIPIQPISKTPFETEITEAQFEGWGKYITPGDSAREFRYVLLRCMNDILDMDATQDYVIRLWGLEAFVQKNKNGGGTKDHEEIIKLIHAINHRYN